MAFKIIYHDNRTDNEYRDYASADVQLGTVVAGVILDLRGDETAYIYDVAADDDGEDMSACIVYYGGEVEYENGYTCESFSGASR